MVCPFINRVIRLYFLTKYPIKTEIFPNKLYKAAYKLACLFQYMAQWQLHNITTFVSNTLNTPGRAIGNFYAVIFLYWPAMNGFREDLMFRGWTVLVNSR